MRRFVSAALPILALLHVSGGVAASAPRLERLAEGVLAVLQPDELRFNDSNSLAVDLGGELLVVDTQASLAATEETIRAIRGETAAPVRWLVLTHWHGDHVQGVAAYRDAWPGVTVVGHETLLEDIPARSDPGLAEEIERYEAAITTAREKLAAGLGLDDAPLDAVGRDELAGRIERAEADLVARRALPRPLPTPDVVYSRALVLDGEARRVRLFHLRAHSRGDTIVWLPDDGVVATGDVLDDLPFGGHGYPAEWLDGLDAIGELPFETIVPGHGAVRRGREHFTLVRELTASIVDQARAAAEAGRNLETTLAELDLERFRQALVGDDERSSGAWDAFVPATAERAWLEARGELPD